MKRQEFKEYTRRTGAVLTVAGAAFLGRVGVMPALAAPEIHTGANTPEKIDKKAWPISPEGVPVIVNEQEAYKEAQQAFSQIKERENGVLILHAPKKQAEISFTESPTAYADPRGPSFRPDTPGAFRVTQYLLVNFKTKAGYREYAVTYNSDPRANSYAFLDLDYAKEIGAVTFGRLAGLPEKSPFTVAEDYKYLPKNQDFPTTPTPQELSKVLDVHNKIRRVIPSSMPRP